MAHFPWCGRRKQCRGRGIVPRGNLTFQRSVSFSLVSTCARAPSFTGFFVSLSFLERSSRQWRARRHVRFPSSWTILSLVLHPATSSARTSRTSNRFQRARFVINSAHPGATRQRPAALRFFVVCGERRQQPEAIIITLMRQLKPIRVQLAVGLNSSIISFASTVCLGSRGGRVRWWEPRALKILPADKKRDKERLKVTR